MTNTAANLEPEKDVHTLLDEKNALIRELRGREAHLSARCHGLEVQLSQLTSSTSWRLTRGLRIVAELKRKLSPLLRFGSNSFSISPMEERDGEVISYLCNFASNASSHAGAWVKLKYRLDTPRKHQTFFVYYDCGSGFSGQARCLVTLGQGEGSALLRLPDRWTRLRLDPFDSSVEFNLEKLRLIPQGKLQLVFALINEQFRKGMTPLGMLRKARKAYAVFRTGGLAGLRARMGDSQVGHDYEKWVQTYDTLSESDLVAMRAYSFKIQPLISFVMPTYNTPGWALRKAIDSVLQQTYENWELCIADDCSTSAETVQMLKEYEKQDARIKVNFRKENGHISAASNSALELVQGEYTALLDHDDELTADALFQVVDAINKRPSAVLIYSDEDKITEDGLRHNPYFKSDWNPELLLTQNYICHFSVMRTEVVRSVGGFREGFEGAQDWDLILRVTESGEEQDIVHIPHILYHWRAMQGSTAAGTLHKPYVMAAQKKAVEEHLQRTKVAAQVSILEDISQLRVRFEIAEPKPSVGLIIPTKDQVDILRTCVRSILEKTAYNDFNITIIDNRSEEQATFEYFQYIQNRDNVSVIRDDRPFNFSALNNRAAQLQTSQVFGFINNDIEVIDSDWLAEMVGTLGRESVGAVGARLYYPHNVLQHGGVVLGIGGVAGHSHKGRPYGDVGYFNRIILPHNVSAVTAACMLVKSSVFKEVGGFDEGTLSVAFNDVDLCLKIRESGYRIVYNPHATLYHHESVSRGYETTPEKFTRFESEIDVMQRRWGKQLAHDPYYNPNLTIVAEDFSYAFPPRVEKSWKKS